MMRDDWKRIKCQRTPRDEMRCREIARLREALEMIAGLRQPTDNLMSNVDIALTVLKEGKR